MRGRATRRIESIEISAIRSIRNEKKKRIAVASRKPRGGGCYSN